MCKTILIASALLLPAAHGTQDGRAEYEKLVAAFAEATAQYRDADSKLPDILPDEIPFHAEFLAAAERHAGSDAALPFLGWVLQNAPRNRKAHGAAVAALDEIAKARAAEYDPNGDPSEKQRYRESRNSVRHLKYDTVSDEVFAQTLLAAKSLALAAESEAIRAASARSVFKLENLRVGMVAPEIVGTDLAGVEFNLSDYRDKVVVIDFWGDW